MKEHEVAMEADPEKINDYERHVEASLYKEGQVTAADNAESKKRNKSRAESRDRIKGLSMNPNAYSTGVKHAREMTQREHDEWVRDYNLTYKVMSQRQQQFWPEEALKAAKREEARKREEAEEKTKKGVDADTNPRSNPKRGGAGKKSDGVAKEPRRQIEGEAEAAAAQQEQEQAEGAKILEGAKPTEPLSQTEA